MKRVHYLVSSFSLCSHLVAIVYSTISVNKLTEVNAGPTRSVMDLLARDYELQWVGSNVHFLLGLLGMAGALLTFAQLHFGSATRSIAYMVSAAILQMIAVVNDGIGQGDGGRAWAQNLPTLLMLYLRLLLVYAVESKSLLILCSIALFGMSMYHAVDMVRRDCPEDIS